MSILRRSKRITRTSVRLGTESTEVPECSRIREVPIIDPSSDSDDEFQTLNVSMQNVMLQSSTRSPVKTSAKAILKQQDKSFSHDNLVKSKSSQSCEHLEKGEMRRKSRLRPPSVEDHNNITPPKQQKCNDDSEDAENKLFSPSRLFKQMKIQSPSPDKSNPTANTSTYQVARRALHSTVSQTMPGRQLEFDNLTRFIVDHLEAGTSASIYVSGPPGTGKTATISTILLQSEVASRVVQLHINCTAIKSACAVYAKIIKELRIKCAGRTEKDRLQAIRSYLSKPHKTILLVLDEMDQLESKSQAVLYTIFEWPVISSAKLILIGIANALDLTDRILPRLQTRCELKPCLMHFAPYTKQQIVDIFTERLKVAGVIDVFSPSALQMLAGKVAAMSGDARKALDIGRRVIELVEQQNRMHGNAVEKALTSIENDNTQNKSPTLTEHVTLQEVVSVLNTVYGTSNQLANNDSADNALPLQQKLIVASLLLFLKKEGTKVKFATVGKLHDVYRKVCKKRNIVAVDQSEFYGLLSLIETRGIIRLFARKEPRMHKVTLEWDEEEVVNAMEDKQLVSNILMDEML